MFLLILPLSICHRLPPLPSAVVAYAAYAAAATLRFFAPMLPRAADAYAYVAPR
jgi:hypothetical protein